MNNNDLPSISALPKGENSWRIDWFGDLAFPNRSIRRTQPSLFLHLSRVLNSNYRDDPSVLLSPDSTTPAKFQRKAWVSVGTLPLLRIGDIWRDGRVEDRLSAEVHQRIFQLCTDPPQIDHVLADLTRVDTSPDWSGASRLNLQIESFQKAMFHPSRWIIFLATNLLVRIRDRKMLKVLAKRTLKEGTGATLWGASELASALGAEAANVIIWSRLHEPFKPGCGYLFAKLTQLSQGHSTDYDLAVLRRALFDQDVDLAVEAAKFAMHSSHQDKAALHQLAWDAFQYWLTHEQPYPIFGGLVPSSPRATLLSVILSSGELSDEYLLGIISDQRPDVQDLAMSQLLPRLATSKSIGDGLIERTLAKTVRPQVLKIALEKHAPFSKAQLEEILKMLEHAVPELRFSALPVLSSHYLDSVDIRNAAQRLTGDPEAEIKEFGFELLDSCPCP